jgi:hypothetical protein
MVGSVDELEGELITLPEELTSPRGSEMRRISRWGGWR